MQVTHLCLLGDITGNEQRLAAGRTNRRHRGLATYCVEVGHHHLQALASEGQGSRPADAGCATGDQNHLARKGHAHRLLLKGVNGVEV